MVAEPIPPSRVRLSAVLHGIVDNVYFQPPSNIKMQYPCIRYVQDDTDVEHADNIPYIRTKGYEVIVIDQDPDSAVAEAVADLPMCSFQRRYPADGLNHFVYKLFY